MDKKTGAGLDELTVIKKQKTPSKRQFRRTRIRQWREHRGLTLEQLAERVDLTPSFLSMLESGKRGYRQETLETIAAALHTSVEMLITVDPDDEIAGSAWALWDKAGPDERRLLLDLAKTIIGRH